jgi:hypothetical protein
MTEKDDREKRMTGKKKMTERKKVREKVPVS